MIQRYNLGELANHYASDKDNVVCRAYDVDRLEDKYAKLEAKYKKLGDYCWQLYHEVADLTNPYIEREPEELKEQAKDTLRNFEKDPLFWDVFA